MNAAAKASKITSRIEEDSEHEAEEILREAQAKADEILSQGKNQAIAAEEEIIQKGRSDAELIKQRTIANAKLRSKKHGLDVKEEMIQKAFEEAEKKLAEITSSKEYSRIMMNVIKEGVESISGNSAEVVIRKEDVEISKAVLGELSKKLKVDITLSGNHIESQGGAIIRSKDGKIEVNNTFESRMRRMRDELRSKVARVLFEE